MLAKKTRRILSLALVLIMVISMFPMMASAEPVNPETGVVDFAGLTPNPTNAEGGKIVLNKTAVRTGPEEWEVTVETKIDIKIETQPLEVVFVLDTSGSMAWCTEEAHTHSEGNGCYGYLEGDVEHTHDDSCYAGCDVPYHAEHDESCYACDEEAHTHDGTCCSIEAHTHGRSCCDSNGWHSYHTCNTNNCGDQTEHTHGGASCNTVNCGDKAPHSHSAACGYKDAVHTHEGCTLTCGEDAHTHTAGCLKLICTKAEHQHPKDGNKYCAGKSYSDSRAAAAQSALSSIVGTGEGQLNPNNIRIKYVTFASGSSNVSSSMPTIGHDGSTNLNAGVYTAINSGFSGSTAANRILIILTDGEANTGAVNGSYYPTSKVNEFVSGGGKVYAIGFTHDDAKLKALAASGGYYTASNLSSLKNTLSSITAEITAMVVDPMGPNVEYVAGSLKDIGSASGVAEYVGGKITWTSNTTSINDKTIKFTYKVQLKASADRTAGLHDGVDGKGEPLNGTTYLQYAKNKVPQDNVNFPIPAGKYEIATLETSYKKDSAAGELVDAINYPTTTQAIISDWGTPSFNTPDAPATIGDWHYHDTESDLPETVATGAYTTTHIYKETPPTPTGTLTVTKTTTGNTTPADTLFTVYKDGAVYKTFEYSDMTSGVWTDSNAPVGTYYVLEGDASIAGYTLATTGTGESEAVSLAAESTATLAVTNTYTMKTQEEVNHASFTVNKIDATDESAELEGVEFTLYTDKACTQVYGTYYTNAESAIYFTTDPNSTSANVLEAGTYYMKETKAKEDYQAIDTVWKITVDSSTEIAELDQDTGFFRKIINWFVNLFNGSTDQPLPTTDVDSSDSYYYNGTLHVKNSPIPEQYGELTITKDVAGAFSQNTEGAEATFTVTGPDEFIETFTLNKANGWSKTFDEILVGDYIVTETGAFSQANYSLVTTYSVDDASAVNGNSARVTVAPYESFDTGSDMVGNFVDFINTYTYNPPGTLLYSLTVNHIGVDEDGNRSPLRTSVTTYHGFGEAYRLEAGEFTDWTFLEMDEGSDAASGTMNGNKVVTFIYAADTDITPPSDPLAPGPSDDPVEIPDPSDPLADTPQTSDGNNMFLLIAIMLSCALGLVAINLPRRKKNEK